MWGLDRTGNGTTFTLMASNALSQRLHRIPLKVFRSLVKEAVTPVVALYAGRRIAEEAGLRAQIDDLESSLHELGEQVALLRGDLSEGGS